LTKSISVLEGARPARPAQEARGRWRTPVALLAPFLACALQLSLWDSFKPFAWFCFYPAAFFSGWVGRVRDGVLASAISVALVWLFFLPMDSSAPASTMLATAVLPSVLFLAMGTIFARSHEKLRDANQRVDALLDSVRLANEELEHRVQQRTAELRQAQKMEAVGQLAGGIAHDFNNLLTVILSGTSAIQGRSGEDAEMIQEVRDAATRAAALTRQLLTFSRKGIVEPHVVELNQLVAQTGQLLRRLLREDIELDLRLGADTPPVRVDAGHWGQVLLNLAVNARDAMPRGGRLTIETSAIELESLGHRVRGARLVVSDTGVGMSEAVKARLFEPFFTTKPAGRGTGLGLAVIHGIVEQSRGTVRVSSEPGQGSTFVLELPAASSSSSSEARKPEIHPEAARPAAGTERVLFVEDEAPLRRMAVRGLRARGYDVVEAADAEEALAVLVKPTELIDLMVTDLIMPGMSGRALSERASVLRPYLPVLFTTGYTDDVVMLGAFQGSAVVVQKPYTIEELAQRMRERLPPKAIGESARGR
jgi:signal transduction histidine kinase/ActR/RegA family two-component response regulator